MSQNITDVCNSALQKVGARAIMNIEDNSREARVCKLAYDGRRRAELRKHNWRFSIRRAILAPDVATPAFDLNYQYTLPSDCVRVILPTDVYLDWVIEGRKILTNEGPVLNLRYIKDEQDPTVWDTTFYDLMGVSMALEIVEVLTNSSAKKSILDQEYKDLLAEARRNNAFEVLPVDPVEDSFWVVHRT